MIKINFVLRILTPYVDAPAYKKRKTGPIKVPAPDEVSEEEEPEEDEEDEDAVPPPGGGEDEDDEEEEPVEGESGDDAEGGTAKVSEPVKPAAKIKGTAVVPKEADVVEVEGGDDD